MVSDPRLRAARCFGLALKAARINRGMSQRMLPPNANSIGLTPACWSEDGGLPPSS